MAQLSRIVGAREMARVLKQLPDEIRKRALATAARAGARVIQAEATARFRVSGAGTDRLLQITAQRGSNANAVTFAVTPTKKKWFLRFLEFGTRPHVIKPGRKARRALAQKFGSRLGRQIAKRTNSDAQGVLANIATGQIFGRIVHHPGIAARHPLESAVNDKAQEAIDAMGKTLGPAIERAAKKLAGSFAKSGMAKSKFARGR